MHCRPYCLCLYWTSPVQFIISDSRAAQLRIGDTSKQMHPNRDIKSYPSSNLCASHRGVIIVNTYFLNQGIVNLLRLSHAYMRQLTNNHFFRRWLVTWPAPSHHLNWCWNIVNWIQKNRLPWNLKRNSCIFIKEKNAGCACAGFPGMFSPPPTSKEIAS